MATAPAFAATPVVWAGIVPATADTSNTAPTNVTTLGTAGAGGTKIEEIVVTTLATSATGIINIFLHDGSTYHLFDQILTGNATVSATVPGARVARQYANLILPSNAWSLRVTCTVAGMQSNHKVVATGASF